MYIMYIQMVKSAYLEKSTEKEENLGKKVCKQIYRLRAIETTSTNIDTKLGCFEKRE